MQAPITLSAQCFGEFLKLIHELTGITIANNRTSMVEGRLRKRVAALNLANYEAYLDLVRKNKSEQVIFINLVTTNETHFFRTPRIWEYMEKKFLPEWFKTHPKKVFMIWSAAASSGEEAHSLGIICQAFKEKNPEFLYQIVGTDISQEMVALCQKGQYSAKTVENFKSTRPVMFQKYMKSIATDTFQANQEIRSRIKFQQHNLFNLLPLQEKFDLVLIRNVLIYFTAPDQEKVLSQILPKLASDGLLIIGESESLSHIKTPYKHVEPLIYNIDPNSSLLKKAG